MERRIVLTVFVLGLVLALPGAAAAQSSDTAAVLGTIVDAQGGVLPGVTVTAKNVETGVTRSDVTSATGAYRLRAVPPGRYEFTAELSGFQTNVRTGVVLTVGAEATINFTLQLAGVSETVTVEANAPIVDTTNSTIGANLDSDQIQMLPTISRDYRAFLRVVSGTSDTSQGISFLGARAASNNWQLDGVDNTANASGGQRSSPQIDTIAEFQVLTNSFKAEYGHAAGGVVNAITRSGSNAYRGSGFVYYRDERFRAYSPFDDRTVDKAPFQRMYAGGTAGGPIKKNRAFFFGAYERLGQESNTEATWVLPTANAAWSAKMLRFFEIWGIDKSLFGAGGQQRFVTAVPSTQHKASLRLDVELGGGHALNGRFAYNRSKAESNRTGTLFDLTAQRSTSDTHDVNLNHKWALSGTKLNELYVAFSSSASASENIADMPVVEVQGFIGSYPNLLGGDANLPQYVDATYFQVKDHFVWSLPGHELKVGGEYRLLRSDNIVKNFWKGYYIFPNLQLFTMGIAVVDVQQFGNPNIPLDDNIFGAFVQDDWRPTKNLTLSFGARYDYQIAPLPPLGTGIDYGGLLPSGGGKDAAIGRDKNNVAPRFGFVWALDDKQAVYGGTGIYYDQVILNNYVSALFTPPYRGIYTISMPSFPEPITTTPATTSPNIGYMASDFRAPYGWNTSIGYRRELTPNMGIDMSVNVNRGESQQMQINRNPGLEGTANINGQGYVRRVPTVGNANEYNSNGYARYKAFRVELKRRMHNRLSGGVAYTLGKSDDNSYYMISNIQVPTHPELNYGPSTYDIRHQLVAHAEVELPWGIQAAGILEARSSRPLNITTTYDLNGDGITGDWVNDKVCRNVACSGYSYSRNSVRSLSLSEANALRALFNLSPISTFEENPGYWNMDLTLRKAFRFGSHSVSVAVEAFNLFNTKQYNQPNQVVSSGLFGKYTSVVQPRTVQVGVHYRF